MNKLLNCPNCGAPITGLSCDYCGTQFFNIADMEVGKPGYLRMKLGDSVNFFKAIPILVDVKTYPGELPSINITVELEVVKEEGILLRKYEEDKS